MDWNEREDERFERMDKFIRQFFRRRRRRPKPLIIFGNLPALGSVKQCEKCGGKVFSYLYVPRRAWGYYYHYPEVRLEHIIRRCRCGLEWKEAVLDE